MCGLRVCSKYNKCMCNNNERQEDKQQQQLPPPPPSLWLRAVTGPRPSGGNQPFLWRLIAQRSRSPDQTDPQNPIPGPGPDRASAVIIIKLLLWHTNRLYCSRVIVRQCFQLVVSFAGSGSGYRSGYGFGCGSYFFILHKWKMLRFIFIYSFSTASAVAAATAAV